MRKSIDLSNIYQLRSDFTIIGLTGRSGSGVSTVAQQLAEGFGSGKEFTDPLNYKMNHNSYRKYRIIYNYAKENFHPYKVIHYRNILLLFILKEGYENFIRFLRSKELDVAFTNSGMNLVGDFCQEIKSLEKIKEQFEVFSSKVNKMDFKNLNDSSKGTLCNLFFSDPYSEFCNALFDILKLFSRTKRNYTLQVIANNLRRSGNPYNVSVEIDSENTFTIVEIINQIIKTYKKISKEKKAQIVIDSLRNPFEIMFFRQRFSAFYTIAINCEDDRRNESIQRKYEGEEDDARILFREEYNGARDDEFYKQKVSTCIQHADIHISYIDEEDVEKLNREREQIPNASPYFTWRMQLLKFVSLISHPGLIPPSPEERCMQMAYTAKYNSGCISRQVGAAITDEAYSIKAIGWNNTPEGQVPCVLRNAEDLLNEDKDVEAFTPYERKKDGDFHKAFRLYFEDSTKANQANLKGRNVCFCFKSIQNSCSEGKNQVHTRSLHAEESAFLQITKYGGTGIKNGKLFTTASPCELCSKKAYQLGIKVIYYVDPYPGISKSQILEVGTNKPTLRLFNGAIGNAYHWLYEPFMAYKDELSLILGQKIQDKTSQLEERNAQQAEHIEQLENQIEIFKTILASKSSTP